MFMLRNFVQQNFPVATNPPPDAQILDQCTLISNRRIITHIQDCHHLPATTTQRNQPILPLKESPASLNATHPATSRAFEAYHLVYKSTL